MSEGDGPETRPHRPARPRHRRRRLRRAARRARRGGRGGDRAAAGARRRADPLARATSARSSRGSDLIVELMGGTDPAREYVLDALRAGRPVVTANKQLLAQHGDELFDVAREAGVQLRFEAAVAGGDPDRPHDPGELRRHPRSRRSSGSSTGPPTSSSARWRRAAPPTSEVLGRGAGARLRRGRPDRRRQRRRRGGEDGDPRAARLPHPGRRSPRSPTRGSRRSSPTTSPTPRSSASR